MKYKTAPFIIILALFLTAAETRSQAFRHPGIDLTAADLAFIKTQVEEWNQPWKDAFDRLKGSTDLKSEVSPVPYVLRGPYGRPDIGAAGLRKNAGLAYDCALLWYLSGDRNYARKAIEILNSWSATLSAFDLNDAKLLAGWTGHLFCNAAELLRHSNSGWQQHDIDRFTGMLMKVYYPVLRNYYPGANGNWDAAIVHSLLAIAVFTDNPAIFNNAVGHYLHGPLNGSLFRYIWPNGQCQESTRDQGHVQLGLTEYSGAARIAFSQGIDLFSAGDNRLALGFEFTARVLLGERPFSYGVVSERNMEPSGDWEHVYRHYRSAGIELKYTGIIADSLRGRSPRALLTASRAPSGKLTATPTQPRAATTAYPAGALASASAGITGSLISVEPGDPVQPALDSAAVMKMTVLLKKGIHIIPATLKLKSGITISGEGPETVLFLDPASGLRNAIENEQEILADVTLRNFVIEGGTSTVSVPDPNTVRSFRSTANRGGIILRGQQKGSLTNIQIINLTIRNCTFNGLEVDGAAGLIIRNCNLDENGSSVVPGPGLQHNLLIKRSGKIEISGSRITGSPYGSGISLSECSDAGISNCEIARNALAGIMIAESENISIRENLIEAGNMSGIRAEFLHKGSENIRINDNLIQYNQKPGIESYAARRLTETGNRLQGNGTSEIQVKITDQKELIFD